MNDQNSPIFALDIGTRSIVGILAIPEEDKLSIQACEVIEHQERSMLDGQIHDVIKVSEVIQKIKTRIENQTNITLTHASVAAAGRSLKTVRTKISRVIKDQPFTTRDEVVAFELEAVQQAQKILVKENEGIDKTKYHCVGYSIVEYTLDDIPIGSIIDQFGEKATIDVIATFLPKIVVDSLQAALDRAGLEISALTLEPIAAINVLIPATMRKLNLALVDIGAGTSDIALTAEGTVTAYAMVPIAGDEITEAISQKYLLDFNVAEELKRSLHNETVIYEDVLGFPYEAASKEIISEIRGTVENLAKKIAEKILELNKQSPQAVMLVGGGSMTPLLPELLAQQLHLPKERVAVRGADAIKNLIGDHNLLKGPEAVTPVGIVMSAKSHKIDFINLIVNQKKIRVFDLKKLTVGDALIAAGIDMNKLHGKPGMALSVEVNGHLRMIRGELGTPAKIILNGNIASLESPVQEGDELIVEQGKDGQDASAMLADILTMEDLKPLTIYYNRERKELPVLLFKNGQATELSTPLQDRDQFLCYPPSTVKEAMEACGVTDFDFSNKDMTVTINGQEKRFPGSSTDSRTIYINDQVGTLRQRVREGDQIEVRNTTAKELSITDVVEPELLRSFEVSVRVNQETITMKHPGISVTLNGAPAKLDSRVKDLDSISIIRKEHIQIMFNDIFKYIDIMSKKPKDSSRLRMTLNHMPATFDASIKTGDVIELEWIES
ncbi:hypothetical protein BHU72_01480 [Desulfuribacillus stibiiarsenatis]|uniref:SHS2 domain-containing protein n=1 Tax=Desulfuribacillus stibiiarsenatis TaxID=1390249 RepID=A0A1E5LA04_9FIRM|nr:cell division FtsA domain-containing protein [Desulfuribacillus stibiiarsenatis]OEH86956.1 hypothetical protein BHU72_01480 [Desulfuribacillus stibiiarsenatis]